MTDERFEFELRSVLREIAGSEAPASLRNRLADVTAQPPNRWLWFSPPLRLATAFVALAAVLAVAFLLMPRENIGPLPTTSPSQSDVRSPSQTPSASGAPTPSPEPSPSHVITGLEWSGGVTPFAPNTSWISDIRPWGNGYVAVGGTFAASGAGQGTVFSSTDGQHWTVQFQAELPDGWSFWRLVPLGDGLLAISDQRGIDCPATASPCPPEGFDVSPRLWYSTNGGSWTQIDSPSWREALGGAVPFDIVGGDNGVLALLYTGVVVHSTDGQAWQRAELPASATAVPRDLTSFGGGFVVVGRDGERDPFSQVTENPLLPGEGRPAAWVSPNGIDWVEADVEGSVVQGGELRHVAAGANGLSAAGIAEAVDTQVHEPTTGWASADGLTWTVIGRIGEDLPLFGGELLAQGVLEGDGTYMLILGPESADSPNVVASVSTDGITWERVPFSGATTDFVVGTWDEAGPQGVRYLTHAWMAMPRGVIVQVFSGNQEYWFGAALGAS